jgi:hypothetical protein
MPNTLDRENGQVGFRISKLKEKENNCSLGYHLSGDDESQADPRFSCREIATEGADCGCEAGSRVEQLGRRGTVALLRRFTKWRTLPDLLGGDWGA